ncbi:hypothetical protein FA95DRAFT_1558887 [Auriscalpium vulgare]|uniref:Uncharacterized protein n=1 Tax=Auriscalpium vulgare TaxID=40419 RepID=A0ACB8RV32_9AGAM|nr:hypothetical protein FA95DRAFT_1558887 [Auriscalpium vulgare]
MAKDHESAETVLWSTLMCNYSSTGSLAFTFWDLLLTSDDMIQTVWTKPWTLTSYICVAFRAFSLASQIVASVLTLGATETNTTTVSATLCLRLIIFQGAASQVLTLLLQIVLILRVVALYHDRPFMRYILGLLWIIELVFMSLILRVVSDGVRFNPQCVVTRFPVIVSVFFVLPIVMEALLFFLTMKKFRRSFRDGWVRARAPWIQQFMSDGIWAFVLPLVSAIVNLICMATLNSALSSVAFTWQIAIPAYAGYNLIIHLRKVAPVEATRYELDTGIYLDTIAMNASNYASRRGCQNHTISTASTGTEAIVV